MADLTMINTDTGEVIVSTAASNGARHLRNMLLDARRPVIEAKLAEAGKQISTIAVEPSETGRWLIRETGARYTIAYKSFTPAQQPTAREPGGRMVEVFDGMKGFALPAAEAAAYRRNRS